MSVMLNSTCSQRHVVDFGPAGQTTTLTAAVKNKDHWAPPPSHRKLRKTRLSPRLNACGRRTHSATVLDDPAGGVHVELQQFHDPLVLLGSFHELRQGYLTCRAQKHSSDIIFSCVQSETSLVRDFLCVLMSRGRSKLNLTWVDSWIMSQGIWFLLSCICLFIVRVFFVLRSDKRKTRFTQ